MITENLSTLKIHKLTQEQYDRELEAGRIDGNAIYLTTDEEVPTEPIGSADAVLYTEQTLSTEQQAQARENIGAASVEDLSSVETTIDKLKKPVLTEVDYETTQNVVIKASDGSLGNGANTAYCVAKANVIPSKEYIVSGSAVNGFLYWAFYDAQDTMLLASEVVRGESQKSIENVTLTAPENASYIRVSYIADNVIAKIQTDSMELVLEQDAVHYTAQTLTEEQKTQARVNIGAVSESLFDKFKKPVLTELNYETTANVVIKAADGVLANAGNTTYCVAKATVEPQKIYTVSGSTVWGFAFWAFYDENDTFIKASETAKSAPYVIENVELTAPENAKYIRVSYITDNVVAKIQTISMELVLEQDAVLFTEQTLTPEQKAQSRANIGAASENILDDFKKPVLTELDYETTSDVVISASNGNLLNGGNKTYCVAKTSVTPLKEYTVSGSCRYGFAYWAFYDEQDSLLEVGETAQAAISTFENVTLTAPENAKYLRVSYITDTLIAKIRTVSMELVLEQDAVLFTEQELTEDQQAQARGNIGAASADRLGDIEEAVAAEKNYESTANVVISGSNGNLLNAGNKIYCVAKVSVKPQKVYTISGSAKYGFAYWAFYDAAGALLQVSETSKLATGTIENVILTAPENASYMHVSYSTESVIAKVQTIGVNDPKTKWKDKKWVCIGDSLTDANNTTTTKRYFDYVYYDTGIKTVNMGVSGSGYARRADDGNAFYQRVENIDTTADVVTIFGSFNDLGAGLPTGTATDTDTTTLGGCINKTIDVLQAKIPTIVLGIVSPTPWETTKPTTSGDAYNYVQLLKEICELRSIPFLDLWRGSNLRPWDEDFRALAYSKDNGAGTHPDETGHKIIAPKFKTFLETLIM